MSVDDNSGASEPGPDWEKIARREVYCRMYEKRTEVAEALNALAHKIERGEEVDGDDIHEARSALQDADEFLSDVPGEIAGEEAPGDEANDELVNIGRSANGYLTTIAKRRAGDNEPPDAMYRQVRGMAYDLLDVLDEIGAPTLDDEPVRTDPEGATEKVAADGGQPEVSDE